MAQDLVPRNISDVFRGLFGVKDYGFFISVPALSPP